MNTKFESFNKYCRDCYSVIKEGVRLRCNRWNNPPHYVSDKPNKCSEWYPRKFVPTPPQMESGEFGNAKWHDFVCPTCKRLLDPDLETSDYCSECGQSIDWENGYETQDA